MSHTRGTIAFLEHVYEFLERIFERLVIAEIVPQPITSMKAQPAVWIIAWLERQRDDLLVTLGRVHKLYIQTYLHTHAYT